MSKFPKLTLQMREMQKKSLADLATRRESVATLLEHTVPTKSDVDKAVSRDISVGQSEPMPSAPKTLPKVTLYAHQDVLKAIRRIAVEDGVQAQEILRSAVRDYLATRGYHFTDLTTGQ